MISLCSIIVPSYNQAEFLKDSLNSVLEQSYSNWECIIIDDGSEDDTSIVAKKWCEKDVRFRFFSISNGGLSNARNFGIAQAEGIFILPLDADDKISPEYLELAIKAFEETPELKLVYCLAAKFGKVDEPWSLPPFSLINLSRKNMIFSSAVFKKDDWVKIGGYDLSMRYGWEDWEFWISLLKNGGKVEQLNITGFFYRIRENSMMTQINHNKAKYLLEYLSVKHADFFVRYYGSFNELDKKNLRNKQNFISTLKSEKFVLDLFCKTFFGFTIFGTYKQKILDLEIKKN
ncbi:hypothetical protein GCM10007103_32680 [Salinimicrobium marinum]|uniref:Glycosyltransferase 2-like domain-containing protein n=1 Tax=Salinimicrobium marinum TaxID=680283 RepID=A0A918SMB5_9FLAO|nr:glycosyltransferase [Salinimicrobium marinum]GHA49330.1 hypothetical protein GCM10007103_32680 [Salinimicrobium marinum]